MCVLTLEGAVASLALIATSSINAAMSSKIAKKPDAIFVKNILWIKLSCFLEFGHLNCGKCYIELAPVDGSVVELFLWVSE